VNAPSIVANLLRAYARREELHTARASIEDPPRTRRDRARILAHNLSLKAIGEEIAAMERDNGGPLTSQQRAQSRQK